MFLANLIRKFDVLICLFVDFSISFFLRRHFSVELNQNNKIALRKEVTGILRQKLNMDGQRQEDGVVQYNFNFNPKDEVQLFLLE
jgi:hypothetical protein